MSNKIISCTALKQVIGKSGIKILDASWYMPAANRNPLQECINKRIPTAQYFDIDKQFASDDPALAHLPHMIPTVERFEKQASLLGLQPSDQIYLYDGAGIFSACRAWFVLSVFGHDNVAILDGGLPAWEKHGFDVQSGALPVPTPTQYKVQQYRPELIRSMQQVLQNIGTQDEIVIDARSKERWQGKVKEPRAVCVSGRIPQSLNVPFDTLLTADKTFKSEEQVRKVFEDAGYDFTQNKPVVTSCGSGITASVLAFALRNILHKKNVALYDGSWAEYGMETLNNPIQKE